MSSLPSIVIPIPTICGAQLIADTEFHRLVAVSKNPLRRLADQLVLASMRPPMAPQLMFYRPDRAISTWPASASCSPAPRRASARPPPRSSPAAAPPWWWSPAARICWTTWSTGSPPPAATRSRIACDLSDLDAVDALVADVEEELGGVDILINNAGRSIRRPLAESLDRWHDVERTMTLNYYSPLRLIRGFAPGMLERGDGHIINVSTWGVLSESSPLFAVYNASKAALSAVSRVIETEWGTRACIRRRCTTRWWPPR